jgi:hypothetical protein
VSHLCLTFLHHISKIWEGVLQFLFLWIFSQCVIDRGWIFLVQYSDCPCL